MSRVLVVYASRHQQTEKIANVICDYLYEKNHTVDIFDINAIPLSITPNQYDAIILGSAIHFKGYPRKLKKWTKLYHKILNEKPSAFFSVCLGILQKEESVQKEVHEIVTDFFHQTSWHPAKSAIFAGGLKYSRYNWITKMIMRKIAEKAGGDTDTWHDYEYTNWTDVKNFISDFSESKLKTSKVKSAYETECRNHE